MACAQPTMYLMISDVLKPAVTRIISPVARFFLRIGLTPNAVTVIGAVEYTGAPEPPRDMMLDVLKLTVIG